MTEEERAEAIVGLAEVVEDTSNRVADLTEVLRRARQATHDELAGLRKLSVMVLFGLGLLVILALVSGYTLYLTNDSISPDGSRYRRSAQNTAALLVEAQVEIDCRARRIHVGLPAPMEPRERCTEVTPSEVYPGTTTTLPPLPNPVTPPTPPTTAIPEGTSQSD